MVGGVFVAESEPQAEANAPTTKNVQRVARRRFM
jgi:hypothetical protein